MSENQSRWNPFLKEWVVIAPNRSVRPILGQTFIKEEKKSWTCPFCPDAPEGAGQWVVKQLPNRFASLDENAPPFAEEAFGNFYKVASNFGKCEVILYSQDHNKSFGSLDHENIVALIRLWQQRYQALAVFPQLQYAFIFENRGKEIGVSLAHPHGQIYAFPYLPPRIEREFHAVKEYHQERNRCLQCDILHMELSEKVRIIDENETFVSYIPYYANWPFEIHIVAKRHIHSINECNIQEVQDLAKMLRKTVNRYDKLRDDGQLMPYIMSQHNAPFKLEGTDLWHFHIEIYTPFRGKERWKYMGGVESGTNTFINDSLPEQNAKVFRDSKV